MAQHSSWDAPLSYMTVSDILMGKREGRWAKFAVYEGAPTLLVFIAITSILANIGDPGPNTVFISLISTIIVFYIPVIIAQFSSTNYLPAQILRFAVLLGRLGLAAIISRSAANINYENFAPTLQEVRAGIWTAIITAVILALYLRLTQLTKHHTDATQDQIKIIERQFEKVALLNAEQIEADCSKLLVPMPVVYAILIYESFNRPKLWRRLENWAVRLFRVELTVGIAQVRSRKPLSDSESITILIKRLSNYSFQHDIAVDEPEGARALIATQNTGHRYVQNVYEIYDFLESGMIHTYYLFHKNDRYW